MIKFKELLALAESPDQEQVRADLAAFFGPKADRFLAKYERMFRTKKPFRRISWNWPVFFLNFVWFFYRKMYLYGSIFLALPLVLGLLLPDGPGGAGLALVFALCADHWYVTHALKQVAKADALGLQGAGRTAYLQERGGVSRLAGGIALVVYLCITALAILAVLAKFATGM